MSKRAPLTFDVKNIPAPASAAAETSFQANVQTRKHTNNKTRKQVAAKATSREGRQFIAAHVLPEAAKQFKLLTVQKERTTQSMLIEAINDLFAKHGLSRIADE